MKETQMDSEHRDALITQTATHPGWQDRLLILFGWNVDFYIRTATENVVGASKVEEVRVNLTRPKWMPKHKLRGGYGEVRRGDADGQ